MRQRKADYSCSYVKRRGRSWRCGRFGVGEEGSVDDVGESSLEGSEGFGSVLPWRAPSFEVGLASWWQRIWVMAMRWMAALSWRLPVRESRCRSRLPDHTGSGAVPLWRAKASLDLNRRTSAVSATILAAVSAPTPTTASRVGASVVTRSVISRSRARSGRSGPGRGRRSRAAMRATNRPSTLGEPGGDGVEVLVAGQRPRRRVPGRVELVEVPAQPVDAAGSARRPGPRGDRPAAAAPGPGRRAVRAAGPARATPHGRPPARRSGRTCRRCEPSHGREPSASAAPARSAHPRRAGRASRRRDRCRQSSTAQRRSGAEPLRPAQHARGDRRSSSPSSSSTPSWRPRSSTATTVWVRLCASIPSDHHGPVTFHSSGRERDRSVGTPQWGRCHAPIKPRRPVPASRGPAESMTDHEGHRRYEPSPRTTTSLTLRVPISSALSKRAKVWSMSPGTTSTLLVEVRCLRTRTNASVHLADRVGMLRAVDQRCRVVMRLRARCCSTASEGGDRR